MRLNVILDKLGLQLGMQVIDTKEIKDRKYYKGNEIYELVKDKTSGVVFKNKYDFYFQPLYVLTHLGTRFIKKEKWNNHE